MERGQEMGENVEIVLGIRDGIQVRSSFHTNVKDLENYKDLLTSTSTQADHATRHGHEKLWVKRWLSSSYTVCVF